MYISITSDHTINKAKDEYRITMEIIEHIGDNKELIVNRMKPSRVSYFENKFPLIDLGYSRDRLFGFYNKWGLEPPVKSGCYCCPFARPAEMVELDNTHRDLIDLVIDLEENAIAKNPKPYRMRLINSKYTVKQIVEAEREQTGLDDWWLDEFGDMDECEGACFL